MDHAAFITGGTGLIGSYLIRLLQKKHFTLYVITRKESNLERLRGVDCQLEIIRGELSEQKKYEVALQESDVVFHLAAQINVDIATKDPISTKHANLDMTLSLLETIRKVGKKPKLVYMSSTNIYGNPEYLPIDEKHPIKPLEPYSASKAGAEMFCQAYSSSYGFDYASIRSPNVYGPSQAETQIIPKIVGKCLRGEKILFANKDVQRDFIHAYDAAEALFLAFEKGSGPYNIGSRESIWVNDLVRMIIDEIDPEYSNIDFIETIRRADIERVTLNSERARNELGWKQRYSLKEGILEVINHQKGLMR